MSTPRIPPHSINACIPLFVFCGQLLSLPHSFLLLRLNTEQ